MNRVQKFMHKVAMLWCNSDDRPKYMCDVYFKFLQVVTIFAFFAVIFLTVAGVAVISLVRMHQSYFAGTEPLVNVLVTDIVTAFAVSYLLFQALSQNFSSLKEKYCTKIAD